MLIQRQTVIYLNVNDLVDVVKNTCIATNDLSEANLIHVKEYDNIKDYELIILCLGIQRKILKSTY